MPPTRPVAEIEAIAAARKGGPAAPEALLREGVVEKPPSGKKDFAAAQAAFNRWSVESGRDLTALIPAADFIDRRYPYFPTLRRRAETSGFLGFRRTAGGGFRRTAGGAHSGARNEPNARAAGISRIPAMSVGE